MLSNCLHLLIVVHILSFSLLCSVKATSGINGTPTTTQALKHIPDNAHVFYEDTALSAAGGKKALVDGKLPDMPTTFPLVKVLTGQSGPAVEWLMEAFGLDLSLVSQLGGHSFPRTHRGKERFPGMTITYALMEKWVRGTTTRTQRARTSWRRSGCSGSHSFFSFCSLSVVLLSV